MSDQISLIYSNAALTFVIAIGRRLGLIDALAWNAHGADSLAEIRGVGKRYVKEWLAAMVCGRLVEYDPTTGSYRLAPDHAAFLRSDTQQSMTALSLLITRYASVMDELCAAMRRNEGLPYSAYGHDFHGILSAIWSPIYDQHLIEGFLGCSPSIISRLHDGADVLEFGCGEGRALALLARQFPRSRFTGIDISVSAIASANKSVSDAGNVTYIVGNAPDPIPRCFDVVLAFDTIHDLPDPAGVLRNIAHALSEEGFFVMVEFDFSSHLEENIRNPYAVLYYTFSLMHCIPVSFGQGGPGLGAVWGLEEAEKMLKVAGFSEVSYFKSPRPQNCVFVCRR